MAGHFFPFIENLTARTKRLIAADAGFYLFIAAYAAAALAFLAVVGASDQAAFAVYVWRWLFMFGFFLPLIAVVTDAALLAVKFRKRPMLAARRLFSAARLARMLSGLTLLMGFGVFQASFTSIKNGLPFWRGGFVYDRAQADLDKIVHFGTDPWRLLYRFAGFDWVRMIVEFNYNVLWFMVCFGALFFVATSPLAARIRTRYLVCFSIVWVLIGNVFAGIFLSAGPAFYGFVTGDTARFGEQLAFLAHSAVSPNSAAAYQAYLWSLHESSKAGFGSGISAFPSVHVALITMNALFLHERHRKLGLVAFAYVAFVAASSVFLAWHYAVDCYASMLLSVSIFLAARKFMALFGTVASARPAIADAVMPVRAQPELR